MKTQYWRLDTARQTMVFAADSGASARCVYWNAALPAREDLGALDQVAELDVTGGMLDENPAITLCPLRRETFPGHPGLQLRDGQSGEVLYPTLLFCRAEQTPQRLILVLVDTTLDLELTMTFEADLETQVIRACSSLSCEMEIFVDWLAAPVLPVSQQSQEMIDFSGKWVGEFQANSVPWCVGIRLRDNPTGRTGHEHFPGLIVPGFGATNTSGEAYGFHYGWSGGHRMIAEELPDGRRQVQFGHANGTQPTPAKQFETAWLYLTYSPQGLNGVGTAFQRHVRDRIVRFPDAARPRPVHYNCWEAVYFNHRVSELQDIATMAAEIGAERFVLDDGWFKDRSIDDRALGDWVVDQRKYPDGLMPLIDHVHSVGMSFGLWFEPEMLNLDSALYRTHPQWLLGHPDQVPGRQQYALNIALEDVQDYLFHAISAILSQYPVDYIKWDHNRVLPMPDAAQTSATYALLDRLRLAHPNVEIESCSSGGGRIDFGILERTHRVWLSDSNDAVERLKIQHNAALFLPLAVTGSHVGPRTCHTSGRQIGMSMRAWVAAQRHMGFEMDPRELTEQERTTLKHVTAWWKANRDWMAKGDILRLDSNDPAIIAEQQIAADGSRFVVFVGKQDTSSQVLPRPLALSGLDPQALYEITLVNRLEAHKMLSRGSQALKQNNTLTLSGQALMHQGVALPWAFVDQVWVLEGKRLGDVVTV